MTKDNHLLGKLLKEQWISVDEKSRGWGHGRDGLGQRFARICKNLGWRWRKVLILFSSTVLK